MRTITIKELHEHTGEWVRKAADHKEITVTDRGMPVALIRPIHQAATAMPAGKNPWLNRKLLPEFAKLQERLIGGPDSTRII